MKTKFIAGTNHIYWKKGNNNTPTKNTKQQKWIFITWASSDPCHTPPGARTWPSPPCSRPPNTRLGTSQGTVPETGGREEMEPELTGDWANPERKRVPLPPAPSPPRLPPVAQCPSLEMPPGRIRRTVAAVVAAALPAAGGDPDTVTSSLNWIMKEKSFHRTNDCFL